MFAQLPERRMHVVRWIFTIAWLLIIASLFYDPWTSILTEPNHAWSPLRLSNSCISVQGKCLVEQPYPLATTLFWGAIVPSSIFILLVFGHEVWRRICPLSFLSQIPRALGKQRQFKRENPNTGKVRYELAKVKSDSWLGKNYPYVQFGWLFVGLCGRILFFNADRLVLALWLLFTIAAAITIGYLYGGKSWCNYFCPMAPVQQIYSEPGGLLSSKAHTAVCGFMGYSYLQKPHSERGREFKVSSICLRTAVLAIRQLPSRCVGRYYPMVKSKVLASPVKILASISTPNAFIGIA